MTKCLPLLLVLIVLAPGCARPRYTVMDAATVDFSEYGRWSVPAVQIATHIPRHWAGRDDQSEWTRKVRKAAAYIGERTKARLDEIRTDGKPLRVSLKLVELKPARDWGGTGKYGEVIVEATFLHPVRGEAVGRCRARINPVKDPFADVKDYIEDLVDQIISYVTDNSMPAD